MSSNFRIGVAVFILDELSNQFVLGKRKGGWEAGTWALPGGHLEHGESFEECARREVAEETAISIRPEELRVIAVTNDNVDKNGLHYVTVFMACIIASTRVKPKNLEPDKCEGWELWTWDKFLSSAQGILDDRKSIFPSLLSLIDQHTLFDPLRYYEQHI